MNLSSIALKRLREQASKEPPFSRPPPSTVVTKKTSTTHSVRKSNHIISPTAANKVMIHATKERTKVSTPETKASAGTYYLDEIFKTSVNMEMHQKSNPQTSDNPKNLSSDAIPPPSNDDAPKKSSSSRKSFDSALQKVDRKMIAKRNKLKESPALRKQMGTNITASHSSSTVSYSNHLPQREALDTAGTSGSSVKTKPTSLHVQKLLDKGYAKVKSKSDNHVLPTTHQTNRISIA